MFHSLLVIKNYSKYHKKLEKLYIVLTFFPSTYNYQTAIGQGTNLKKNVSYIIFYFIVNALMVQSKKKLNVSVCLFF